MGHQHRLRHVSLPYESGREGDAGAAGFAPRKPATVVYLPDGVGAHEEALERLGPHTTGLVCVYIKNLEAVDLGVLEGIVSRLVPQRHGGCLRQARPRRRLRGILNGRGQAPLRRSAR